MSQTKKDKIVEKEVYETSKKIHVFMNPNNTKEELNPLQGEIGSIKKNKTKLQTKKSIMTSVRSKET